MNKTILMAGVAALLSSQAMAADLTNPFFAPKEGQITSDTKIGYSRTKGDHFVSEGYFAAETLEYGINNQFSVNGTIYNLFDTQGQYNNDHNFAYDIGVKYNTTNCRNMLLQLSANYTTLEPQSWFGKPASNTWEKYLSGEAKLGYELDEGLVSYVSYGLGSAIDTGNRDLAQSIKLGVHKYTGEFAVDAGVRYEFETESQNSNTWWADASADYYVSEDVALGVYGSYFLDGNGSSDIDYDYEAGAHVKFLFK